MTDKELKKLNRAELLELLLVQTRETERLRIRLEKAEAELSNRQLQIEKAGNLAHAVLEINGIMDTAQAAAQQYLDNIEQMERDTKLRCDEMLSAAGQMAEKLRTDAAEESEKMLSLAREEAEKIVSDTTEEANRILSNVKAEAEKVLSDAQAEAEKVLSDAKAEAEQNLRNAQEASKPESVLIQEIYELLGESK